MDRSQFLNITTQSATFALVFSEVLADSSRTAATYYAPAFTL